MAAVSRPVVRNQSFTADENPFSGEIGLVREQLFPNHFSFVSNIPTFSHIDVYRILGKINAHYVRPLLTYEGASIDEPLAFDCRQTDCCARERSVSVWNTSRSAKQSPAAWTPSENRSGALCR